MVSRGLGVISPVFKSLDSVHIDVLAPLRGLVAATNVVCDQLGLFHNELPPCLCLDSVHLPLVIELLMSLDW